MRNLVLAIVVTTAALVGTAHAARFQVQPTLVELAGEHHTGSITITNRSDVAVRFQVKAMSWEEGEDGTMKLASTEALVVYPTLFTLKAGASRSVRVASAAAPGTREVPYRIFVEELPPLRRATDPAPARVAMLTRMGIPVFLPAATAKVDGEVEATLAGGLVALRLHNRGTVRVRVATVRVIGLRNGVAVFDRSQAGWYLLAGGTRRYQLPISSKECAALTGLRVEVVADRASWRTALEVAPGSCNGTR